MTLVDYVIMAARWHERRIARRAAWQAITVWELGGRPPWIDQNGSPR